MGAAFWGVLFSAGGLLLLSGLLPTEGMATGPRVGMTVFLLSLGLTLLAVAVVPWVLRRTTRPEDHQGNCPVGWACAGCGAFNLRGRSVCRSCGALPEAAAAE